MTQALKLCVASQNPVKINAAKEALQLVFPGADVESVGVNAPSLVAEQPMTEDETREGAENRLDFILKHHSCDFAMAMEGGVDKFSFGAATFAYVAIGHGDKQSIGRSALLPIPDSVYQSLCNGEELGDVMDQLFNQHNIKQRGGAIGVLTQGLATRQSVYTQALILAMAPFMNPELY